jgi:hypothetical protein
MSRWPRHGLAVLTTLAVVLVSAAASTPRAAFAAPQNTTFSGRATVVSGSVLGVPIPCLPDTGQAGCRGIVDTGDIAAEGGSLDSSLACYPDGPNCVINSPVGDPTNGAVNARVLHAAVESHGNTSRAEATVADLHLVLNGLVVDATFLRAAAQARCSSGNAAVSAGAEVARATVNGEQLPVLAINQQQVVVQETPNYHVEQNLPLGLTLPFGTQIIVNEQPSSNGASGNRGEIDVTALHVIVPGVADLKIASAHADITCAALVGCPGSNAFVTGGGFVTPTGAKDHFAVVGRNEQYKGHVLYRPATGDSIHVKDPYALVYSQNKLADVLRSNPARFQITGDQVAALRSFQGAAILIWYASNGNVLGEALAIDGGEPARGVDYFELANVGVGGAHTTATAGFLAGGNIQMHGKC